jgi:hypothetical protein
MNRYPDAVLGSANRCAAVSGGVLVINADDWGRDAITTARILDCVRHGAVASVSAMVFMEDSLRAAEIARERGVEAGLHLNLTTPFSAAGCARRLVERQQDVSRYLRRHPLAQVMFHPGLMRSFEYVVEAQIAEFRRLYGAHLERIDGHHHMHLCANVLFGGLLPREILVRRNFSFQTGEKSLWNRLYRRAVDAVLARRYRLVDYFFSLGPLEPPSRLERIFSLARRFVVEMETHPVQADEYRFLVGGALCRRAMGITLAPPSAVPRRARSGLTATLRAGRRAPVKKAV